MYWWVKLGYPDAFDVGKDGFFPRTGQVVVYYRKQKMDDKGKAWTQKALARTLGLSDASVRDMEKRDTIMDFERRQFLCKLFNIPPILLGVYTPSEIERLLDQQQQSQIPAVVSTSTATSRKLAIDTKEYSERLSTLWTNYFNCTLASPIPLALVDINALYQELPRVRELAPIQELLCGYHEFLANALRDHHQYNDALDHLEKALLLADTLERDDLKAVILYRKGSTYDDADLLDKAADSYRNAKVYERKLPSNLRGSIFLCGGLTNAKTARNVEHQDAAIRRIDSVGTLIRNGLKEENPHFLNLDVNHYHIDKGVALIAIGRDKDALDELNLVRCGPDYPRRQALADILSAQAYANIGNYERASEYTTFALEIFLQVNSEVGIARAVKVFKQLQQSPYKDSPDIARIDYLLFKKQ